MEEKLRKVVENDSTLTESNLRKLIQEFLDNEKTSDLLSILCDAISPSPWYTNYKITVVLKYLCDKHPKEFSSLLLEKKDILESLRNYSHRDDRGCERAANIQPNAEQLLDFINDGQKFDNDSAHNSSIWTKCSRLNSAMDQLSQTLNSIKRINSEEKLQTLRRDISECNRWLGGPITFEKYAGLDVQPRIDEILYGKLLEKLLEKFDDKFPLVDEKIDATIAEFVIIAGSTFSTFHEILLVLDECLKKKLQSPKVGSSYAILLEKFMTSDCFHSAILDLCKKKGENGFEMDELERKWKITLQIIVSLPSRVANSLDGKISKFFSSDIYTKIIVLNIAKTILFWNSLLENSALNVKIMSMLISKAIITFGARKFEALIDILCDWCAKNPQGLRNIINQMFQHIDRQAIEPMAVLLLKKNQPVLGVDESFDSLMKNPNWRHVFLTKIPLMSYHEDDQVAINLIQYLAHFSLDEKTILTNLVTTLLDIWGDRSALNHTPFEQHEYITKLVLLGMERIKNRLTNLEKQKIRSLLISGTAAHLESTQSEIRAIGMITGETIIKTLQESEGEPILQYEYDGMPEKAREIVEKMRKIAKYEQIIEKSSDNNLQMENEEFAIISREKIRQLEEDAGIFPSLEENIVSPKDSPKNSQAGTSNEEKSKNNKEKCSIREKMEKISLDSDSEDLDSDDDLEPYDMSNDRSILEKLRPTYLRDLRENLCSASEKQDPNIFSESMKCANDLISSQLPHDDPSFGLELLQLLVNLTEISYVENFQLLKYEACVTIVTIFPKETAKYLCNEFHKSIEQHSIQTRLFILDILRESARKLSKIEIKPAKIVEKGLEKKKSKKIPKKISLLVDQGSAKKYETLYDDEFEVLPDVKEDRADWEEIVSKRIEANTRIFAHSTKKPITTMNKFNDAASSFFYPLLYGFRRQGTCLYSIPSSFEDQENLLLVNYLKTLSAIMQAAENCVIVPRMAKEMMELSWTLRYHKQAAVRYAVIANMASVLVTLPKDGITPELLELILELRNWLSDVSESRILGDPDSKCRDLGKNVIALIDSMFQSALNT